MRYEIPRDSGRHQEFDPKVTASQAADSAREGLQASVAGRLVADVPVGFTLSGGMDSSAILLAADRVLAKDRQRDFATVSAVYDEDDASGRSLSEAPFIAAAREGSAFPHHQLSPQAEDIVANIDAVIDAQGEPFPHTSVVAQWFVYREARSAGRKVMLSGQGADEILAGYSSMAAFAVADRVRTGRFLSACALYKALIKSPSDRSAKSLAREVYRQVLGEPVRRGILNALGKFPPQGLPVAGAIPEAEPLSQAGSALDELVRRLTTKNSLPALLRYEDRNAMAHGVETRLPFLGADFADLGLRMPGQIKISNGWTKKPLRDAFRGLLPDMIVNRRRKLGFVTPQDRWLAGDLGRWVRFTLEDQGHYLGSLVPEVWRREQLRRLEEGAVSPLDLRMAIAARWASRMQTLYAGAELGEK